MRTTGHSLPQAGHLIPRPRHPAANRIPTPGRRHSPRPAPWPASRTRGRQPYRWPRNSTARSSWTIVVPSYDPPNCGIDTESAPDASELLRELPGGGRAWAEACGSVPLASFTITKLRWLRRCEPESFRRMAAVLLPHDWLTFRLTGEMTTDRGDASGTGYWSPAEGRYRSDLLGLVDDRVDWDTMVPTVLDPDAIAGTRSGTGSIVAPGTGDNMASALALGLRPGDLSLSFGTSGVACTVSEEPRADASGAVAGFADATGRFLPLVCTLNATKVTDSVARLLGVSLDEFDALACVSACRCPRLWCSSLISTVSERRTGRRRPGHCRGSGTTSRRPSWPEPPSKGWSATSWAASTPWCPVIRRAPDECSWSVAEPGVRPTSRSPLTSWAARWLCPRNPNSSPRVPPSRQPPCSTAADSTTWPKRGTWEWVPSSSPTPRWTMPPSVPPTRRPWRSAAP